MKQRRAIFEEIFDNWEPAEFGSVMETGSAREGVDREGRDARIEGVSHALQMPRPTGGKVV